MHNQDERAEALRILGAEVIVGDLRGRPTSRKRLRAAGGCASA
jgi:hypothetical protein